MRFFKHAIILLLFPSVVICQDFMGYPPELITKFPICAALANREDCIAVDLSVGGLLRKGSKIFTF